VWIGHVADRTAYCLEYISSRTYVECASLLMWSPFFLEPPMIGLALISEPGVLSRGPILASCLPSLLLRTTRSIDAAGIDDVL
jgi:hypothetical protein